MLSHQKTIGRSCICQVAELIGIIVYGKQVAKNWNQLHQIIGGLGNGPHCGEFREGLIKTILRVLIHAATTDPRIASLTPNPEPGPSTARFRRMLASCLPGSSVHAAPLLVELPFTPPGGHSEQGSAKDAFRRSRACLFGGTDRLVSTTALEDHPTDATWTVPHILYR